MAPYARKGVTTALNTGASRHGAVKRRQSLPSPILWPSPSTVSSNPKPLIVNLERTSSTNSILSKSSTASPSASRILAIMSRSLPWLKPHTATRLRRPILPGRTTRIFGLISRKITQLQAFFCGILYQFDFAFCLLLMAELKPLNGSDARISYVVIPPRSDSRMASL